MEVDYSTVTEIAGEDISQEQLERLYHRYYWAGNYCEGKDVVEVACGTGPGIGFLAEIARTLQAGDFTPEILAKAQGHYGDRVSFEQYDAQNMPYEDNSVDVVILFEAIYYIPDASRFVADCRRILRSGGVVLIATANKDLYDFNPSPYTHRYYGNVDLHSLFEEQGFEVSCFGHFSVQSVSTRQKILRPIKKMVVSLGIMPKTMRGKKLLKRIAFGDMIKMPAEIQPDCFSYTSPEELSRDEPNRYFKVIYCEATLKK